MVAFVRLVAALVAMVCLSATLQTGSWRGPADLASVGEGHSLRPDRRSDHVVIVAIADDDGAEATTFELGSTRAHIHDIDIGATPSHARHVPKMRHSIGPRGPPTA